MKVLIDNLSNPVMVGETVRQIILAMLLFQVIHWTEEQTLGFLSAVSAVIALVVRGTTVSTAVVDQRVDERVAHRELAGTTSTGDGMTSVLSRTGASTPPTTKPKKKSKAQS